MQITNVSGETLDARTWAGETVPDGGSVDVDAVVADRLPDAVVVALGGEDGYRLAVPRSQWTVAGEDTAPEPEEGPAAEIAGVESEDTAPRDRVTVLSAHGATFSPGAATEGNPLGLFVPNEEQPPPPPADPPADPPPAETTTRQRRTATTTDGK